MRKEEDEKMKGNREWRIYRYKKLGLTDAQIAEKEGITRQAVGKWRKKLKATIAAKKVTNTVGNSQGEII